MLSEGKNGDKWENDGDAAFQRVIFLFVVVDPL